MRSPGRRRGGWRVAVASLVLAGGSFAASSPYTIFPGDGSEEPGFVPPPVETAKPPPPPPKTVSSAETFIPFPPVPVVPMARSETKKPPKPPVLFTKLRSDRHVWDWSATPNDVNNLLRKMKGLIDVDYSMEIRTLAQVDTDPEKNPILYRSGHYHFEFTPAERQRLRAYLLDGGMLILNTGLGSKPFYDSAVRELRLIFPEVHLQRLSSDHPVFHSYYDVDRVRYRPGVYKTGFKGDEPWFDGVTINCRTVALVSRWGLAVGWEERENPEFQAYESASAQRLGINIFAYATAQRAWVRNAARLMSFADAEKHSGDKVSIAQVVYDGEWKTRHVGIQMLLHQFNVRTDIPVRFAVRELRLSDPALFDIPMLYMTGHEDFLLKPAEVARLREYLLNGGFLFVEACCGRKGFDRAFREQFRRILPQHELTPAPAAHPLFANPNRLAKAGVTPALAAQLGNKSAVEPMLYGAEVGGHYAVVYSPFGLAGGWELSPSPYAFAYDNVASFALAQNILMYAVTQ